jgi:hypothetical protein
MPTLREVIAAEIAADEAALAVKKARLTEFGNSFALVIDQDLAKARAFVRAMAPHLFARPKNHTPTPTAPDAADANAAAIVRGA